MDKNDYRYMDDLFLDEYKDMERLNLYNNCELEVADEKNATILTYKLSNDKKLAGVIDENGKYIDISAFEALSPVDSWGGAYELESEPQYIPETVVYLGRFWKHWGHFLMDMVSRLWYVLDNTSSLKIAYDSKEKISGVYLEFLKLLGISENQLIRVTEPTKFYRVIIPECSHKPGISCNEKYKQIFDVVSENALLKLDGKNKYYGKSIYFTRRMLKSRVPLEVGENDIEKLFKDNGFLIIAPEQFPLVEQIAMIRQADKIACLSGTLPHNMMFARDESELIIIRKTNKPNYRQVSVNQIRNLKVTNVDAHISLNAVGPSGPFIVVVNKNVKAFFTDNYGKCNYSALRQWCIRKVRLLWYIPVYFLRNRKMNREVPIFDGNEFTTTSTAKKELFNFYVKRI